MLGSTGGFRAASTSAAAPRRTKPHAAAHLSSSSSRRSGASCAPRSSRLPRRSCGCPQWRAAAARDTPTRDGTGGMRLAHGRATLPKLRLAARYRSPLATSARPNPVSELFRQTVPVAGREAVERALIAARDLISQLPSRSAAPRRVVAPRAIARVSVLRRGDGALRSCARPSRTGWRYRRRRERCCSSAAATPSCCSLSRSKFAEELAMT